MLNFFGTKITNGLFWFILHFRTFFWGVSHVKSSKKWKWDSGRPPPCFFFFKFPVHFSWERPSDYNTWRLITNQFFNLVPNLTQGLYHHFVWVLFTGWGSAWKSRVAGVRLKRRQNVRQNKLESQKNWIKRPENNRCELGDTATLERKLKLLGRSVNS